MEKEFFMLLFNTISKKYGGMGGALPFIGKYLDVQHLPIEKIQIPFYLWGNGDGALVFSFNMPLLQDLAIKLAMTDNKFYDLTINNIFYCLELLVNLKKDSFMKVMEEMAENKRNNGPTYGEFFENPIT
jgi:hypothetical protein